MPAKTDIIESGLASSAHPQRMRLTAIDRVIRGTGLFRWQLRGKPRGLLRASLQDPWRGDLTNGRDILSHRLDPLGDAALYQELLDGDLNERSSELPQKSMVDYETEMVRRDMSSLFENRSISEIAQY